MNLGVGVELWVGVVSVELCQSILFYNPLKKT